MKHFLTKDKFMSRVFWKGKKWKLIESVGDQSNHNPKHKE